MKRLVMSKKIVILVLLIVIVLSVPWTVYGYNNYNFNKLYNSGIEQLNNENFEEAINAFESTLKYNSRQKELIQNKVNLAKELKESKSIFDSAVALADEKKYLEAIDDFKAVKDADVKRYSDAQNKIKECSESYIKENLDAAKNEASNKNYDKAISYLDTILKFDNNNKDAQSLKDEYNNRIKQIAEDIKKAEEDRLKAEQAKNAVKIQNSKPSTSGSSSSSNSGITYKYLNGDYDKNSILILNDNGKEIQMYFSRNATWDTEFRYGVWQCGATSELPYTIKFSYNGVSHTYSAITSREKLIKEFTGNIKGSKVNVEVLIQYKNKTYPINVTFAM